MKVEMRQLEPRSCGHNCELLTVESDTLEIVSDDGEKNRNSGRLKRVVQMELEKEERVVYENWEDGKKEDDKSYKK